MTPHCIVGECAPTEFEFAMTTFTRAACTFEISAFKESSLAVFAVFDKCECATGVDVFFAESGAVSNVVVAETACISCKGNLGDVVNPIA